MVRDLDAEELRALWTLTADSQLKAAMSGRAKPDLLRKLILLA